MLRTLLLIGISLACGPAIVGCQDKSSTARRLRGAGATFIEPLMSKWQVIYEVETKMEVNYTGFGSGAGVQQMIAGTLHFGCTDAPLTASQIDAARRHGGEVISIPLALGSVVPIFNLPSLPSDTVLNFTGSLLADIFLGDVKRWNDPSIRELNPNVALPDLPIHVVSRSEPSGTTAIFAEFLCESHPEKWKARNMGQGTGVAFETGVRQKGGPGVAGDVSRMPGAIGYVELTHSLPLRGKVGIGAVRNRAGKFIVATPETIAAAADTANIGQDLFFSLVNRDGAEAYPISGADWAVFYRDLARPQRDALVAFLRWATDPEGGQRYASPRGYAPLSKAMVDRVQGALASLSNP